MLATLGSCLSYFSIPPKSAVPQSRVLGEGLSSKEETAPPPFLVGWGCQGQRLW